MLMAVADGVDKLLQGIANGQWQHVSTGRSYRSVNLQAHTLKK